MNPRVFAAGGDGLWKVEIRGGVRRDRVAHYESGIAFTGVTPEQQAGLAAALEKLQAAQTSTGRKSSA